VAGTVNLAHLAGTAAAARTSTSGTNEPHRIAPLRTYHGHPAASRAAAVTESTAVPSAHVDSIGGNVSGEAGSNGVDAQIDSSHNSPFLGSVGIVTPPDQGLAVGADGSSTAELEIVNDTLDVYSTTGKPLIAPLAAFQVFDQAPATFMSDPRAYWDAATGHWILTMFAFAGPGGTVGQYGCDNGGAVENHCLSAQFVAVSVTTNPIGSYKVFWFDTSDGSNSTATTPGAGGHIGDDCPCFGDYDMVGADHNGLYITTNEFCFNGTTACAKSQTGGFNGTVLYALPKTKLIGAAEGKNAAPTIVRYGLNTLDDPFAAYHLSPSTVTQGSPEPSTEYFVESNANLPNNPTLVTSGLEVFALLDTGVLATGGAPPFVMTTVGTEPYTAVPPVGVQKSGPTPLGTQLGYPFTPSLQTDFNAIQETTYASGDLYTELDTGLMLGQQENSGVAWFVLKPKPGASSITVSKVSNAYVEATQDILYPDISVNASGVGYMVFALAGPDFYPSAAYTVFNGAKGAAPEVHIAMAGANPLDDFSCYPTYGGNGACRYGDYSAAQNYNGTIYMATEYIPNAPRDELTNWGTRVFHAPA
jgi:hypothetical protein